MASTTEVTSTEILAEAAAKLVEEKSATTKEEEDEASAKITEDYFLRLPAASMEAAGDNYFEDTPSSSIFNAEKSLTATKSMPTKCFVGPASSKINESSQGMVELKVKQRINISSDYFD